MVSESAIRVILAEIDGDATMSHWLSGVDVKGDEIVVRMRREADQDEELREKVGRIHSSLKTATGCARVTVVWEDAK